jgi:hypothetical protein|tara:strand:- start:245 stop:448 length:204 start_codon:yes stop_codon:yes gene_type:complete
MHTRQSHQTTTLAHTNDDPCDNWQAIGSFIRLDAERVRKAVEYDAMCEEIAADDNFVFLSTFTRFGG